MDKIFQYDEAAVDSLRKNKPWTNNVRHFKNCKVSVLAAMKMLRHALAGVEKGRKQNGVPIEIMGLMIGKPEGDSIIGTFSMSFPSLSTIEQCTMHFRFQSKEQRHESWPMRARVT